MMRLRLNLVLALLLLSIPLAYAATVTLTVVGTPATGAWGVQGTVADPRDVMADVWLDGVLHHTENEPPYAFPSDNGTTVNLAKFGNGTHKVEFVFKLQGTTTELGRATVVVTEGQVPVTAPPGKVTGLTVFTSTSGQLSWSANTEPDVAGYRLYAGFASKVYGGSVGQVAAPTGTVSGLQKGKTYYFAVTAFDQSGNESQFSNEVIFTVP